MGKRGNVRHSEKLGDCHTNQRNEKITKRVQNRDKEYESSEGKEQLVENYRRKK